jgi:hypothetical protein
MKRIVFFLLSLFIAGSAVAQTYACQFIMTAGMHKESNGAWKVVAFNSPEPFFLKIINGVIDTTSLAEGSIQMFVPETSCSRSEFNLSDKGHTHRCSDSAKYLSFSEKTLNGGFALTTGAMQSTSDKDVDSVAVSRFKCQKIR